MMIGVEGMTEEDVQERIINAGQDWIERTWRTNDMEEC